MIFIIGTGRTLAHGPPKYLYNGVPKASAAVFATARDTASMAFAPSLCLEDVPSRLHMIASTAIWLKTERPARAGPITLLIFDTALKTPDPKYLSGSPSRSSKAS